MRATTRTCSRQLLIVCSLRGSVDDET
jgi:hypothetical protein